MLLKQIITSYVDPLLTWIAGKCNRYLVAARHEQIFKSLKRYGKRIYIHDPLFVSGADHIELGEDVSIGPFTSMWGGGGIKIGNRVMIGAHTELTSWSHDYRIEKMFYTRTAAPIVIDDDVWIGAHVVILPGIHIGKGAVVGAGSIVTRDVAAFTIVKGVPAVYFKKRDAK